MKNEPKELILALSSAILLIAFVIGFMGGAFENKNCKYETIISRINLGYVAACELWRPRWKSPCEKKKIFSVVHYNNYNESYHTVTFEDGTSKIMQIDPKMTGKEIEVCD